MSEQLPTPERPRMTEAQVAALQGLCGRYAVAYDPEHYWHTFDLPDDYVAGWIGGYAIQAEHPTLYVGADAKGRISS